MRTLFIQDNFECHFVNLLSFTQQLFSSQLEINHVIQQPKAKKLEEMETTLLCLLVWAGLLRGHDGKNVLEFLQSTDLVT